jgi:hypothetical protein
MRAGIFLAKGRKIAVIGLEGGRGGSLRVMRDKQTLGM